MWGCPTGDEAQYHAFGNYLGFKNRYNMFSDLLSRYFVRLYDLVLLLNLIPYSIFSLFVEPIRWTAASHVQNQSQRWNNFLRSRFGASL